MSFHISGPLGKTSASDRFQYYHLHAGPSNVYDGYYSDADYYFINETATNASGTRQVHRLELSLSKNIQGTVLSFYGSVKNLDSDSFSGFVLVFIVENGLVDPSYPTITWNSVFRDYGLNRTLTLAESSTDTFNGSWTIPSGVDRSNVQVIAAAYDTSTRDPTYGRPYAVQSVSATQMAHDVSITNLSAAKTVVGQGFSVNITKQISNQGINNENFDVLTYANSTSIQTENFTLGSGASENAAFTWNTTGVAMGNYTLSAYAPPVSGETNTANNNCTGGWVIVALVGDVTGLDGWSDWKVDMRDIGAIAKTFGTDYHNPQYNPNYDINGDGKIDMKDIAIAARNFGQHYP